MRVRAARTGKLGSFNGPALLEPFEHRYLAGIPTEDRLWVPEVYVSHFVEKGWKQG